MAYVDLGYSAFERSDEFFHPETGCVLTLHYGPANVRHYMGGNYQDTRPVLRRPEDLLFRITHPAGYSWDDYASGPEQMEMIIGLAKRDNPWDRWIVRGDVPVHGRIAVGTLDQLRYHWNELLPGAAPGILTAHQPPQAGTRAQAAKARLVQDRINRGGAAQAQSPPIDPAVVARQRLGGPGTAFDQAYPGVQIPPPAAQQGLGTNVGAPQLHQPQQHIQAAPPLTHHVLPPQQQQAYVQGGQAYHPPQQGYAFPPVANQFLQPSFPPAATYHQQPAQTQHQQQAHDGHQGQDQDDDLIDPFLWAVQAGQLAGQQPDSNPDTGADHGHSQQ
ncbi:hypothetical protein CLCR_07402 [Cladophialophora carrionii]|uniref:Uncharacterized protein n=1 Tax=Cladophialophora carrionii TaxID=86049 RepID=A0A1C1CPR2_9EURO|nr:hypothetical protein CLCR_07402 [Cladophialophora carrionii]